MYSFSTLSVPGRRRWKIFMCRFPALSSLRRRGAPHLQALSTGPSRGTASCFFRVLAMQLAARQSAKPAGRPVDTCKRHVMSHNVHVVTISGTLQFLFSADSAKDDMCIPDGCRAVHTCGARSNRVKAKVAAAASSDGCSRHPLFALPFIVLVEVCCAA